MKFSLLFVLMLTLIRSHAQKFSADFKSIVVNKKVLEYPDKFDLSTPLNSFITVTYIYINGKDHLLQSVNTMKNKSIFPDSTAPDSNVSESEKERYLDTKVDEIIIYKDSVAFVINQTEDELQFYHWIRTFYLEGGRWVTSGEDPCESLSDAREFVSDRAPLFFEDYKSVLKDFH